MQDVMLSLEMFEFIVISVIIIVLAYLALQHREIVYATFFFGMMAASVAGIFILLDAPFIAGIQIAVYTGGISAIIVFAVLLLPRAHDRSLEPFESPRMQSIGLVIATFAMSMAGMAALMFPWYESFPPQQPDLAQSLEALAQWLWNDHGVLIQMVALIIISVVVGTMTILKMEKAERFLELGIDPPHVKDDKKLPDEVEAGHSEVSE